MKKILLFFLFYYGCSIVAKAQITGSYGLCTGSTSVLHDATTGGTWSSSNTVVATIGSTGTVSGIATGTTTITYTAGTITTATITVDPLPSAGSISGIPTTCVMATTAFSDASSGGIWSSSNPGIATVGTTGVVTGASAGVDTISYTITNACGTAVATKPVTINLPLAAGIVVGSTSVCASAIIILSDPAPGGMWSSSATSVATVGSTGITTGVSAGTSIISYSVSNSCGTVVATKTITVNSAPVVGIITAPPVVCPGTIGTLGETITGGVWSSSNISVASVGTSTGIITGVASGSTVLGYTVSNGCGSTTVHDTITVYPLPFAGTITGSTFVCNGSAIVLTDTTAGGVWSSSNSLATVSGGVVTGMTSGTDTIYYSVTNVCGIANATKTILIGPLPLAETVTGGGNYCSSDTGAHIGLSGSETGVFYQLFTGIIPIGSPVTGTGSALDLGLITAVGTYTVAATNSSTGCNNAMTGSATVSMTTTTTPMISVHSIPGTHISVGIADTFTASVSGAGTAPAYQWYKDGVIIAGATDSVYIGSVFFDGDSIACEVRSSKVCGTAASAYAIITLDVGVAAINTQHHFSVYPNPNNGVFTAKLSSQFDEQMHIVVTNIVGKKVLDIISITNKATEVKLPDATGIYFITAFAATGSYLVRVISTR